MISICFHGERHVTERRGRAGKANAAEQIHCKNKQKQLNAICGGRSLFCGAPTLLSHWVGNTVVCMALLYTCLCACMHSWQHVGTLLTVCRWCPGISSQTCTDTSRPIGAQLDLGQWNQRASMPSSSRNCSTLATWGWPSFCPRMNPEQNVNHGISRLPDVCHMCSGWTCSHRCREDYLYLYCRYRLMLPAVTRTPAEHRTREGLCWFCHFHLLSLSFAAKQVKLITSLELPMWTDWCPWSLPDLVWRLSISLFLLSRCNKYSHIEAVLHRGSFITG